MAVVSPKRGLWLLDNAADVHVCNNRNLFFEYRPDVESLTGATASGASPGKGLTRIQLALEDGSRGALITLHETWYMPQCPVNLISQGRLNNSGVHYNDESWCLYLKDSRNVIGYVPRINNNYVFKTLDNPDMCHRIDRGPLNIKPRHRASSLTQPSASRLTDYAKQSRIAPTEEHWVIKTFHLLCFYPLSNVL